ncbi:hypothetical protein GGI12_004995 [Dipsacomyces acuminosporus]|nr:hypothetical protein GGI12_004995 [Dipsacomyces acuminosporus]
MAATASEMQAQSTEILGHDLATEKQQLSKDIHEACAQLESLNKLVDDIDQNLRQMESAVSKAESAIGMSLSGRLEQLAKFIGSTASGAQGAGSRGAAGVPYLRQWAPKEQAIPQVVNVSEYFDR